jgi:hypothetical protein
MRRIALRIILFLLLGVIMNVAVAWGCAIFNGAVVDDSVAFHNPRREHPLVILITRRPGQEIVRGCGRSGTYLSRHNGVAPTYSGYDWWDRRALDPLLTNFGVATGWPILSVCSTFATVYDETLADREKEDRYISHIHGGFTLGDGRQNLFGVDPLPVILSWRIVWPGFAINTLFYAALLAMLFAAPFALRRWRRNKRGVCVKCAYPVGTGGSDVCPECGAAVVRALAQ